MGISIFPVPTASGFPFKYLPITTNGTYTLPETITRGVYTLSLDASQTVNIQFQNSSGYRVSATLRGGSGYVSLPFDVTALVIPSGITFPVTLGYALTNYTQISAPTGTWAWQASGTIISSPNFTGSLTSSLGVGATGYQILWSDGNIFDSTNTSSPSGQITAFPAVTSAGISRNFILVAKDARGVLGVASSVLSTGNSNAQTSVITFTGSGSWTSPASVTSIDCLVVAGGGAGANNGNGNTFRGAGGGGAGGFRNLTSVAVTGNTTYAITVGAGGAYWTGSVFGQASGNNSSIGSVVVAAGGGGGTTNGGTGIAGGSGGGTGNGGTGGAGNTPSTTPSQGNKGGDTSGTGGAGGGGAGAAASNTAGCTPGGAGAASTITGSSVTYAGGGGGAGGGIGSNGGAGGGGIGRADANADSGVANTGCGGGAASNWSNSSTQMLGGNGGSGIVIIRYSA